jgi:hypothetical protein
MLQATNEIGSATSLVGFALFAAIPDTPINGPSTDASVTNKYRIKVNWMKIVDPSDGGSEVLSYQLEMDDGEGGDFVV